MQQTKQNKDRYQKMVNEVSPNSKTFTNCIKAFIIGGLICVFGQFLYNTFENRGFSKEHTSAYVVIILIFLAILFTGLGLYQKLGRYAGAGSAVPITGFANAVSAPAIEFKKEGMILGMAAKMFVIAGPVIVYGVATSMLVGLIYYLVGVMF